MFVGKPTTTHKRSHPSAVHLTWTADNAPSDCDSETVNSSELGSMQEDESSCHSVSRKRVRFAPMSRQRTYRSRRDMPQKQKNEIWYNHQDFDRVHLEMRRSAYSATRRDICYAAVCDKLCRYIYQITASMKAHEVEFLLHDVNFLASLSESLHPCDSSKANESFRGLEDLISSDRQFLRFDVAQEIRSIIVDLSLQHKDDPSAQEELAQHYHEMSLSASVLARVAAISDASAVQDLYEDV